MPAARRLIESPRIYSPQVPVPDRLQERIGARTTSILRLVNEYSISEKTGGGRPEYWEMVFWWTRKPLVGARFVIAASLLPEDVDLVKLAKALRLLEDKSPHSLNPDLSQLGDPKLAEAIRSASLLDPFAGFGSIPLEAIRLGLREVVAVELLPVAYVFLKAVLEYPAKYGHLRTIVSRREAEELSELIDWQALKRRGLARETPDGIEAPSLIVDVARAGKWILDRLREDPDIQKLYDPDVAVYIGTWEVKCPGTNGYTPLVGNWWLARVKQGNRYVRLAYMKPVVKDGRVEIEVVDLNKIHGDVSNAKVSGNTIEINGVKYQVPEPNIQPRTNTAICLLNGQPLGYIDPETGKTYPDKKQAPPGIRDRLEWYPKWALKQWNKMLEEYLEGKITLEELKNAPARPRIIAKVTHELDFITASEEDNTRLLHALHLLKDKALKIDIPNEQIAVYENRAIWVQPYGFDKFYKIYNPRQLLVLAKIVELIRESTQKIQGSESYRGAIASYLAIALCKFADYNSMLSGWQLSYLIAAHTLAMRGIAMIWNWGEYNPLSPYSGTYYNILVRYLRNYIPYLLSTVIHMSKYSKINVFLGDAVSLNNLIDRNMLYNIIVTDPPYYDDVPYSELSDLFYVWLKRALSDVCEGKLCPRFLPEAFFRRVGKVWRERRTQWEEVSRQEISVSLGRLSWLGLRSPDDAIRWFEERLGAAFRAMGRVLRDDGILATYYNHTSVEAWASLLHAGWEIGGFRVTAAVPLVTESATSVVARGKVRLDTSIVVVWRKGVEGDRCDLAVVRDKAYRAARGFIKDIVQSGVVGYDLLFAALGAALSAFTECREVVEPRGRLDARRVAEEAYRVAGRAVAEALAGVAGVNVSSGPGRFYLLTRVLFSKAKEIKLDGASIGLLQIALGVDRDSLVRLMLLEKGKDAYTLLYPTKAKSRADLERLLKKRGLVKEADRAVLRSSVDALHLLYYAAMAGVLDQYLTVLESRAPSLTKEAVAIARVLCRLLPSDDPERMLACRVAGGPSSTLDQWFRVEPGS